MIIDCLIVGAGPAGAIAACVLARAGARVRLVDRAMFPRDKLCGDTVNPGTLARLRRLGVSSRLEHGGLRVMGMRVTGGQGAVVDGLYPGGLAGRAMLRRDLDWMLVEHAIAAGCEFEPGVTVRTALIDNMPGGPRVVGVRLGPAGAVRELRASVTIAADGRRSALAFRLGLARHPDRPRRWAVGAYFEGVWNEIQSEPGRTSIGLQSDFDRTAAGPGSEAGPTAVGVQPERYSTVAVMGEMHVRPRQYVGIAPVPGRLTNVCLVKPSGPADSELRNPAALLTRELLADPMLCERFASARLATSPVVLGPLAVDVSRRQIDGLLLAGDAAGFLDPMTGDGLRFAIQGGELAAGAALDALQHGWNGVHARLAEARRRTFAGKYRFNRALRALVGSPRAVEAATIAARFMPGALRAVIARAGDCNITHGR
jgi:menaquinone-9 beta-reductase